MLGLKVNKPPFGGEPVDEVKARLQLGLVGQAETVVCEHNIARVSGDGRRQVFATPQMISLMEQAAVRGIDHLLPEGWLTVGTGVFVRHLAATPIGKPVRARAELIEVDRRRLVFQVEAHDDVQKIGEGTHERHIVNLARFRERAEARA